MYAVHLKLDTSFPNITLFLKKRRGSPVICLIYTAMKYGHKTLEVQNLTIGFV